MNPTKPSGITACTLVRPLLPFKPDGFNFLREHLSDLVIVDSQPFSGVARWADKLDANHIKHKWKDSFSEAKNAGLAAVNEGFIFFLECNEQISASVWADITSLACSDNSPDTVHCFRVDVIDAQGDVVESTYEARMWRAENGHRFAGRVYEHLVTATGTRFIFHDDIRIVHTEEPTDESARATILQRNLNLLETQFDEQPDDPHTRYCVAVQSMLMGDFERALDIFKSLYESEVPEDWRRSSLLFAVECMRRKGQQSEALEFGLAHIDPNEEYGELWFYIGRAALEANQRIKAEAAFRFASRVPSDSTANLFRDPSITEWRADLGRAQALAAMREVEESVKVLQSLRARLPAGHRADVDLDFIRTWLQLDRFELAWSTLEPWFEEMPEWCAEGFVTILEYCLHAEGPTETYHFFQRSLVAHNGLIRLLPVATVGAALAEVNGDTESQGELLRLCIDLGSTSSVHFSTYARLLIEQGDLERAREITELGRKIATIEDVDS